jgi:hypothetical protein
VGALVRSLKQKALEQEQALRNANAA